MKTFFKKNKMTIIIIAIFIIVFSAGVMAYKLFFPNVGKPMYGNRLDGITKVVIKDEEKQKLINGLKEDKNVLSVECDIKGRLINVIINVDDNINKEDAKAIGKKVLEYIDEAKRKYYDIQILLNKEDKKLTDFPIIGYKHHNQEEIVYTVDRSLEKK